LEQAPQQSPQALPANLKVFHAELEELFRRVKPNNAATQDLQVGRPMLVIRGK
jgi:hypothetical protein